MTKEELIEQLQKLPAGALVVVRPRDPVQFGGSANFQYDTREVTEVRLGGVNNPGESSDMIVIQFHEAPLPSSRQVPR